METLMIFGVATKSRTGHLPNTGQTRYVTAQLLATSCFSAVTTVTALTMSSHVLPENYHSGCGSKPDPIRRHHTSQLARRMRKSVRNIQYVSVFHNLRYKYLQFKRTSGEYHPRQIPGRRKIFLSRRAPSSSDPRQAQDIFIFCERSYRFWGPTHPPIRWVSKALPIGVKQPGV